MTSTLNIELHTDSRPEYRAKNEYQLIAKLS